jgi:membrane protease YdiL (CAAX protease family)/quercetin dioxygenase-like cupin family protein
MSIDSGASSQTRGPLATFLCLTFGLSALWYALIIRAGSLGGHGGLYVFALMWSPGTSALITRLIFQHNVRGEGWGWNRGTTRWAVLAYLLPLGYATVAYGLVWMTRLGGVDLSRFKDGLFTFLVLGSLQSLLSATGEELGWRGFLVPTLARTMSFGRLSLLSGAIWALWHFPLIIFADYNGGTPTWYSCLCFFVMVVALGVIFAWLRLRSGSVWPAAILHASHNLFVQAFFDRVTVDTGPTRWLTSEFGAAVALAIVATALLFWRARGAVAITNERVAVPSSSMSRQAVTASVVFLALAVSRSSLAQHQQAMTHDDHLFICNVDGLAKSTSGCQLLARPIVTGLPSSPVYWHLSSFKSRDAANAAKRDGDAVVSAGGRLWRSSLGARADTALGGAHVASIGPLPMPTGSTQQVELYYVIMPPHQHTVAHTHPGPEAWYILEGEQCLETPAGSARGRAGQSLIGPAGGTPMQLTNSGSTLRRALFIVVHDSSKMWTTSSDWKPTGACKS